MKKLCLHPYLLQATSLQKKRELGIISAEESMLLDESIRAQEEAEANQGKGIQTRRGRRQTEAEMKKINGSGAKRAIKQQEEKAKAAQKAVEEARKQKEEEEKAAAAEAKKSGSTMYDKFGMSKILANVQEMYDKKKIEDLINCSVKTKFLFKLMTKLKVEGHRVLIFSMSKKMLDLLELMIGQHKTYSK